MTRTATMLCAALATTGLLLAGCTGDEPSQAPSSSAGSDGENVSGADVEDREVAAIVEQTVSDPESPEDTVTIGVQSLAVEGETMVLRLVITPDFASASDGEEVTLDEAVVGGVQFFGVTLRLLDRENLKEYSVIHEGNEWWASAKGEVGSTNGQPMYAFAVFAAPEDDIETVDVVLDEQWPEFTDVPITR